MYLRSLLLLPAVLMLGCFGTTQDADLQTDLDEIKTQLLLLQKEHAAIRDHLEVQGRDVQAALERDDEAGRVGQADLIARVDSMTMEMEILGQKLEDTNFRLSGLSSEIQATRTLMDESRFMLPVGAAAAMGAGAGAAAAQGSGEPASPGSGPPSDSLAPSGTSTSTTTAPTLVAAPVAGGAPPEEIFNTSYADYTKGNYPLAILGFQEYLQRFPDSAFADDALYWVGESYYSQGKYNDAVEALGEVVNRYPQGDKVPAAHLKRGYAFLELNQTAQGVVQLNALIEGFPHTDEARLARERLRSLGL